MTDLTRRSFLRWFGAAAAVTGAGLLVPEAPKIAYSFLTNNPLGGSPIARSNKGAFRRVLQFELDKLREDFRWDMDRMLWTPPKADDPFEVVVHQYYKLVVEKPTASFSMDNITVPNRHLWGRIAIGSV